MLNVGGYVKPRTVKEAQRGGRYLFIFLKKRRMGNEPFTVCCFT